MGPAWRWGFRKPSLGGDARGPFLGVRQSAVAEGVQWQRERPGLAGRAGELLQDGISSPLATSKNCELATREVSLELPQEVMPAGDQDYRTSNFQGIPRSKHLSWSRASRAAAWSWEWAPACTIDRASASFQDHQTSNSWLVSKIEKLVAAFPRLERDFPGAENLLRFGCA